MGWWVGWQRRSNSWIWQEIIMARICMLSDTGTPRGVFRGHGLRWQKLTSRCCNRVSERRAFAELCGAHKPSRRAKCARALNRRAAFSFHTGLTMGKPEVNLTIIIQPLLFFVVRLEFYCCNLAFSSKPKSNKCNINMIMIRIIFIITLHVCEA